MSLTLLETKYYLDSDSQNSDFINSLQSTANNCSCPAGNMNTGSFWLSYAIILFFLKYITITITILTQSDVKEEKNKYIKRYINERYIKYKTHRRLKLKVHSLLDR